MLSFKEFNKMTEELNEVVNSIKSFAEQTGKSVKEVEKMWNEAKVIADKEGYKDNFAYITGILKKMLGLKQ